MKNPNLSLLLAFLLFTVIFSCNKKDDTPAPPPPPVVLPDTLTTGWSKLKAGFNSHDDIFFQNSLIGYAIGGNSFFKTADGGSSWDSVSNIGGSNLAVTQNGKIFTVSNRDNVLSSIDGGATFAICNLAGNEYTDVFFSSNDTGYAISKKGILMRTNNGGLNWTQEAALAVSATNFYCSMFFLNGGTGWIIAGADIFSKKNQSGWTKVTTAGYAEASASIFASSEEVVYAGYPNGVIYKSTNGGLNFTLIKQFAGTGGYLDLYFFDDLSGYACNGNRIYKTIDGGASWQMVVALGKSLIVEIHFTDERHGWACGRDGLILRFNG